MTNFNFLSYLFLISFSCLINYVSTLDTEGINNGKLVEHLDYTYQAGILAKANGSNIESFVCSAVIIQDYFLLSAAHCFINSDGALKQLSFSVIVGVTFIKTWSPVKIEVYKIYTYLFQPDARLNDLAILRIRKSLDLDSNWYLDPVDIPDPVNMTTRIGVVTGYGFYEVEATLDVNGVRRRAAGKTDFYLRSGYVMIFSSNRCKPTYPYINNTTHLCGFMFPSDNGKSTGICFGDGGSPLIMNNKVVGIASKHNSVCDDTMFGSIYTDVSYYKSFIETIVSGQVYPNTHIYENNVHVLRV